MDDAKQKRIEKINSLRSELGGLFWEIDHIGDFEHIPADDEYQKIRYHETRSEFKILAKELVILAKHHIEAEGLANLLGDFKQEMNQYLNGTENLFESFFDEENAISESEFLISITQYLSGFNIFDNTESVLTKAIGRKYLHSILENTQIILSNLNIVPKKETDVYNGVKMVLSSVFSDHSKSTFSFQQKAKCYKPDILIQSLNAAVEYKFSKTEDELTKAIEEIRIDVDGYKNHPQFYIFYAVFYLKGNICTESRALEIWKESKFPKNWIPIFIQGK